jgi:hypothetical protein
MVPLLGLQFGLGMRALASALCAVIFPTSATAIELRVYSEFQRVDPYGRVLDADRAEKPRELLSPAISRNAYTSFHVVVTGPPETMYFLAVQANPADVLRWRLYEEKFVTAGGGWVPDTLQEARPPYFGVLPDAAAAIPGQTARVYLLDIWAPWNAPVGKVRLEVLAKTDYWRVWPMEVRVLPAIVPEMPALEAAPDLPELEMPADTAARRALARKPAAPPEPSTVRGVIWRNAAQDAAIAATLDLPLSAPERGEAGAESYLRIRDRLYREASRAER